MLVGDFNGDGKTDLLTEIDGTWEVAYSSGYGFVKEPFDYFPNNVNSPESNGDNTNLNGDQMVVGDFNGDGKSDIAHFDNSQSAPNSLIDIDDNNNASITNADKKRVYVYYSYGSGFRLSRIIETINNEPSFMIAADFNGDGKDDLFLDADDGNIDINCSKCAK